MCLNTVTVPTWAFHFLLLVSIVSIPFAYTLANNRILLSRYLFPEQDGRTKIHLKQHFCRLSICYILFTTYTKTPFALRRTKLLWCQFSPLFLFHCEAAEQHNPRIYYKQWGSSGSFEFINPLHMRVDTKLRVVYRTAVSMGRTMRNFNLYGQRTGMVKCLRRIRILKRSMNYQHGLMQNLSSCGGLIIWSIGHFVFSSIIQKPDLSYSNVKRKYKALRTFKLTFTF